MNLTASKGGKKPTEKTLDHNTKATFADIVNSGNILDGISGLNSVLAETANYWINKNLKKLAKAREKMVGADKAIDFEYCEFDKDGNVVVTDRTEGGFRGVRKNINGRMVVCDMDGNEAIFKDEEGNQMKVPDVFHALLAGESAREDYTAKKRDLIENGVEVNLVAINRTLIENLQMPTQFGNPQAPQKLDYDFFYAFLVFDESELIDEDGL